MTEILIHHALDLEQPTDQTAFGGRPSAPAGQLAWPHCRHCGGAMQFLGQLRVDDADGQDAALVLLFMCRQRPGMCHQAEAEGGGNAAIVVPARDLALVDPPPGSKTLRATRYGATLLAAEEAPDYPSAAMGWAEATGRDVRQVLGQWGGTAHWEELDETPICGGCGHKMPFLALLEQGPDRKTEMNFGGGWAYVFRCGCSPQRAKLLLQC
ncbi:hypothetical protein AACH06_19350 [Ideonella sp. DXS29W]|uniref:DUF1963 domain-containing protein n=1 Tax=Ideonella lacteola TaxID=2984193 RepID=A0ABU9BV16_9BURK